MSYVNVFISYCDCDKELMIKMKDIIDARPPLKSLVVPLAKSSLEYNPEKVKKAFKDSMIFLPIITSNSINNQWVNQEIGYAFCKFSSKEIKPIVENNILENLKGFISKNNDINFRFNNSSDFKDVAIKLVEDLYERFKNYGEYVIR